MAATDVSFGCRTPQKDCKETKKEGIIEAESYVNVKA